VYAPGPGAIEVGSMLPFNFAPIDFPYFSIILDGIL
jgi:hypothetical protein